MTAFAAAIDAIFADLNISVAAEYRAGGSDAPVSLRVVMRAPDAITEFNSARFVTPSVFFGVKVADLVAISEGDTFTIAGTVHVVTGSPTRDGERLTWEVEAVA